MKNQSPIFIIGTERSGSNLLRLILNAHPNIVIPHPPHLMNYFADLDYGDLQLDDSLSRLTVDMLRLIDTHIFPWENIDLNKAKILQEVRVRSHFGIVASIYEQVLQQSGKHRWGCKSTFMIHYIDDVLAVYPGARFILLVRDPRDVSASAKSSVFSPCHPYLSAQLWYHQQNIGLTASAKYPDSIHQLRYEDLLEDPHRYLQLLCAFIEEDFDAEMLQFFQTSEAQKSANLSESWKKTGQPIQKNNVQKYKKALSDQEIQYIESWCFESMQRFHYQPESTNIPKHPNRFKRMHIRFREMLMRIKVEQTSFRNDSNHWIRWKRDATARYFNMTHRKNRG